MKLELAAAKGFGSLVPFVDPLPWFVIVGILAISNPSDARLLQGEYGMFGETSSNGLF